MLNPADHKRVNDAIAAAEKRTTGEIQCVLRRRSENGAEVPLAWAAGTALILPLALVPLGFLHLPLNGFLDGWTVAHQSTSSVVAGTAIATYAAIQAAVFAVVFLLVSIPPVRRFMTPAAIRHRRAKRAALQHFLSQGMHLTEERTGVLIFACLTDHHAEVVADEAIHSKVDPAVWREAVSVLVKEIKEGRIADGYVKSIEACAEVLATHFPARERNPDERPDMLVVI